MDTIRVRHLGRVSYAPIFHQMKAFTQQRNAVTPDELWIVEHDPVFTLGQAAMKTHILDAHHIPIYETDRGGEVTYHGPGQLVVYLLIDLKRHFDKKPIRELVFRIENAIIHALMACDIVGERHAGAPGIYIPSPDGPYQGAKIAALGLKIKNNGCMYHGLALNVAMDLEPFKWINPCGYPGLTVTDMRSLGYAGNLQDVQKELLKCLCLELDFMAANNEGVIYDLR